MRQLFDISNNLYFYLVLAFLVLVNFTIVGCYLIFTLLALALLIYLFIYNKDRKTDNSLPSLPKLPKYYKYFILYIFFCLISTLFSLNLSQSLKDNREFFVFLLIPIFIFIINSKKRLLFTLYSIFVSAVISSFIGIYQAINKGISEDFRIRGLLGHWMTYSGLLMMVFIFFFIFLFYEKKRKTKGLMALLLIFVLMAVFVSLTRAAWVGIFIAIGIFIIFFKPKFLYAAIPALIIMIIFLPDSVKNRISSTFNMNNETVKDRFYMYQTGFNIFKDYPLTGVGADNIEKVYDKYKPSEAKFSNPHLHNNFIQILAERGIFSLISLLMAFTSIFVLLIKKIKNSINQEKTVAVSVLFVFIGFITMGLFEYNLGDTEINFLLFYFLSIPFLRLSNMEKEI